MSRNDNSTMLIGDNRKDSASIRAIEDDFYFLYDKQSELGSWKNVN